MRLHRWRTAMALLIVLSLCASDALAHAKLLHSDPSPRAVLRRAPVEIRLWFSEPLEGTFSTAELVDQDGGKVSSLSSAVSPADAKLLTLKLPRLETGEYTVRYRVLSIDGHVVKSSYRFRLKIGVRSR